MVDLLIGIEEKPRQMKMLDPIDDFEDDGEDEEEEYSDFTGEESDSDQFPIDSRLRQRPKKKSPSKRTSSRIRTTRKTSKMLDDEYEFLCDEEDTLENSRKINRPPTRRHTTGRRGAIDSNSGENERFPKIKLSRKGVNIVHEELPTSSRHSANRRNTHTRNSSESNFEEPRRPPTRKRATHKTSSRYNNSAKRTIVEDSQEEYIAEEVQPTHSLSRARIQAASKPKSNRKRSYDESSETEESEISNSSAYSED